MRAALNILFGCLFLVMQAGAALSPHTISEATPCQCCSCGSLACSTSPVRTAPAPPSSPLASSRQLSSETEKIPQPKVVVVKPVAPSADSALAATDALLRPAGRPLYERYCALLI
jgi:hypothetical protein